MPLNPTNSYYQFSTILQLYQIYSCVLLSFVTVGFVTQMCMEYRTELENSSESLWFFFLLPLNNS